MKTALIANPAAGGGRAARRIDDLARNLERGGFEVAVHRTDGPGHATVLARHADAALVVAAGGDGTTFEVVNGLMQREERPALGIIPLGTGNSFLRDLDITDTEQALQALHSGKRRPVDCVQIRHAEGTTFFINLLSVGFTARAGHVTNARYKGLGAAGYVLATLQCLVALDHPAVSYQLDEHPPRSGPCTFVSFSNSQFTGGTMHMAPAADISDGRLDAIHVAPLRRRRFLAAFPRIFQGTHVQMPEITSDQASCVRFEPVVPMDCMIDGEVMTLSISELKVLQGALEVFA